MAQQDQWPRIAVMGAGAVGCYFGGMLARAGAPVTLIGRPGHVEAIARNGLFLESIHFQEKIPVSASTSVAAALDARIVLFSVKTTDTEDAAISLAPHLAPGALVLCLQNGVDNAERIRSAAGIEAIPAVVYVAVAMTAPGHVMHSGRGDLVIGKLSGNAGPTGRLEPIAALFSRAGIPCRVSEMIETDLWTKMMMNCAYNAISALSLARYGRIVQNPGAREVMRQATEETVAVARASGVQIPNGGILDRVFQLAESMSNATSSTAQDIARGRRTEIDSLNGYVARRGASLDIPTPINHALWALVKLLEDPANR